MNPGEASNDLFTTSLTEKNVTKNQVLNCVPLTEKTERILEKKLIKRNLHFYIYVQLQLCKNVLT